MLKIIIIHAKDGKTGLCMVIKPQDKNIERTVFTMIHTHIHIYIYVTHTHTYIYIYVCVCVCVCVCVIPSTGSV